ncbi:PIN domain-containing protein [Sphingomonas olei]
MFANRYTALVDACSLVDTMRRNLLLTLAEAEFFRVRWSVPIMEETERAIARLAEGKGYADAAARGSRARLAMERAFEEASVRDFPDDILTPLNIEARNADDFIADTIALDLGRAIPALRRMRKRLRVPPLEADRLLRDMEARGLIATADTLASFVRSL